MTEQIKKFFEENKIEYYAFADYSELKEIFPHIAARQSFKSRSAVIYLLPYFFGFGDNISAYAVPRDYHIELDRINQGLIELIKSVVPTASAVGYGDKSPIDERFAAASLGLGVLGDNRLLINERYGSYVFIGEVMTDLPVELLGCAMTGEVKSCLKCGACLDGCPTGALLGSGECLSAITQKKGELTDTEREQILKSGCIWGCDLCQRVCPMNEGKEKTPIEFFQMNRIERLGEDTLHSMSEEEFKRRAYSWRGKKTVLRNLLIGKDE